MIDIRAESRDKLAPGHIHGELIRVVESHEQIATHNLVDTLEEQEILENLLERTKPLAPEKLHYLLSTPFRYPPLPHGSRFGTRFEPSLFYGSLSLTTAFAETGYYRLLFWQGMTTPPPSGKYTTQHTVFGVPYASANGLKLQEEPFTQYKRELANPIDYSVSQALGTSMRDAGIEAFEYISARDKHNGINAALYTPATLMSDRPLYQESWLCQLDGVSVSFYATNSGSVHRYLQDEYQVNSVFPEPAF